MWDCVVLGCGGIGSAALWESSRRGWKTLGLDRYGVAHDRGSSHGQTRIYRTAYFEHPHYVPLAQRAVAAWRELQSETREELMRQTGVLQIGDAESAVIQGTLASARAFGLSIEEWGPADVTSRFPVFRNGGGACAVYESEAGILRVERCVATMVKRALAAGAEMRADTPVRGWDVQPDGSLALFLEEETVHTRRLILCAGPWSASLLGTAAGPLTVLRKPQHWFQLDRIDIKADNGFPAFLLETTAGVFYGIPELDYLGMKIAEHSGGERVTDPAKRDPLPSLSERERCEQFLDRHLEFTRRRLVHESVCLYTMSNDGHFVVDHHPRSPNVVFAAGLSGHGFKFAPVLGRRLVGMLDGESDPLFDFLRADRATAGFAKSPTAGETDGSPEMRLPE